MGLLQQIIPLIIQYQMQKNKEQAQNLSAYAGQEGWEEAEKQFGTKKMLDLYQGMFGRGMMPPQRTLYEVSGELGPSYEFEGMEAQGIRPPSFTTTPRTERIWPQPSAEQMMERGTKEYLQQPGKLQQTIAGKMGEGTAWQKAQAQMQQRQNIMMGVKGLVTSRANVRTKDGTDRPITGPEAQLWVSEILEGVEPSIEISPPVTEANQWQFKSTLASMLDKFQIYGKNISELPPGMSGLVRQAEAHGAAKVGRDGIVLSPTQEEAPMGPPSTVTIPDPQNPNNEIVQLHDKSGKLISSTSRPRWKDESSAARSFTQKQYEDQIDGELSKIFLDEAESNYKKMLQSKGVPTDKMDTLRDLMLVMGGKDPMNAQRIYADTVYKYLPPEQKKRFDRIREQASTKWVSGQVQYVPSIMREILETEETLKAPSVKPPTMKNFIEEQRQKSSETKFTPESPKVPLTKPIGQRATELDTRYKGNINSIKSTLIREYGQEAFDKWVKGE